MLGIKKFDIEILSEAFHFLQDIDNKAREKLLHAIRVAQFTNDPQKFKKLVGTEIWEFRAKYNNVQYRMLSFWDHSENTLVIATHGFIKKRQKTPTEEIRKAERIRNQYFKEKGKRL